MEVIREMTDWIVRVWEAFCDWCCEVVILEKGDVVFALLVIIGLVCVAHLAFIPGAFRYREYEVDGYIIKKTIKGEIISIRKLK